MLTIKNILTIIIKLIGLIFILVSCIFIIPGYLQLIVLDDIMYTDDVLENPDLKMSTTLIITDIFINIVIYYFFIIKTELVLSLIRIDSELGNKQIGSINTNLQDYAQITLCVAAIVLLVISVPEIIISITNHFRVKKDYLTIENYGLIDNIIIGICSILIIAFNDKISKLLTK